MVRFTVVLSVILLAAVSPARVAPLQAYGRLPTIESVSISPSGSMLALAVTNGEQRKIVIEAIEPRKTITTLDAGRQKIRFLEWAGNDHLIVGASRAELFFGPGSDLGEWLFATDFDIDKKSQRSLLPGVNDRSSLNALLGEPASLIIGSRPFVLAKGVAFDGNTARLVLFKVDLDHATSSMVAWGDKDTETILADSAGLPLAESDYDAFASRWTLKLWQSRWREAQSLNSPIERPSIMGLGRDGATVLIAYFENNQRVLREIAQNGGTPGEPLPISDPT